MHDTSGMNVFEAALALNRLSQPWQHIFSGFDLPISDKESIV